MDTKLKVQGSRCSARRELIVAVDTNGAIGASGDLGFNCPEDMAFFKEYTMGKVLWCGRATYPTVANLIGRDVRQLKRGEFPKGCYIGGGAVYASVVSRVDRAVVTYLNTEIENADTFFPRVFLASFSEAAVVRKGKWGMIIVYDR